MKTRSIAVIIFFLSEMIGFGQRLPIELTFTAVNNTDHVQLDSIKVINRTNGGETMAHWPDSTISLEITPDDLLLYIGYATFFVGIEEKAPEMKSFQLCQNFPNPLNEYGVISLFIPDEGNVTIKVTDLQGRMLISNDWRLDKGKHTFSFHPGHGSFFILTACWNGVNRSIKIISTGSNFGERCKLDYAGRTPEEPGLKMASSVENSVLPSGMLDTPESDKNYTFQFATNIPCPGTPVVDYEGQIYNTIQIFSQCWLKENLNVGIMIDSLEEMQDDGIIEKYCHRNEADSCVRYGGLYQWNEMMQYDVQPGARGICPPGWHIPTDEELKVLEGAVDSQYDIGDSIWDSMAANRGFDTGTNLKTSSGWNDGGSGTDLFGFSMLPGGLRSMGGHIYAAGNYANLWSSSEHVPDNMWARMFKYNSDLTSRYSNYKEAGFSVRCLKE